MRTESRVRTTQSPALSPQSCSLSWSYEVGGGEPSPRPLLCGPKLKRQPRSNRTVRGESPRRGGGPPLSEGSVGRAERLLPELQARGPSPRTKGSGDL